MREREREKEREEKICSFRCSMQNIEFIVNVAMPNDRYICYLKVFQPKV